jgi:hypothetical protein
VTSVTLKRGTHLEVTAITTATRPKPGIYTEMISKVVFA